MGDPSTIEATQFFDFVAGSKLAVILVSVHPIHAFSQPLNRQLTSDHPSIAVGKVDLRDLIVAGSPVRFLHQGLRACGVRSDFGVLPGYYFFRDGAVIAWDSGLPAMADAEAIARSALLGAVWSGVSRDVSFVGQALRMAAEEAAAHRAAARFRHAADDTTAHQYEAGPQKHGRVDELFWAYHTLGVLPTASDREVHDAWRQRRRDYHPDHAASDAAEFERRSQLSSDINRARDIIFAHRSGHTRQAS